MKNKTCGECRFLIPEYDRQGRGKCYYTDNRYLPSCGACKAFVESCGGNQPTNGDVIRQMSNRELAVKLSIHAMCDTCPAKTKECGGGHQPGGYCHEYCLNSWRKWLNAPAESEKL